MAQGTCSVEGCERPVYAKGMCGRHHARVKRYGDPSVFVFQKRDHQSCAIEGCKSPRSRGHEWCSGHWHRWQRHGDPLAGRAPVLGTFEERIWQKVAKGDGCWPWLAAVDKKSGRGKFNHDGRMYQAYRFIYELTVGPIPVGMTLDHLCANPGCVNPAHMDVVTKSENSRRMMARRFPKPVA